VVPADCSSTGLNAKPSGPATAARLCPPFRAPEGTSTRRESDHRCWRTGPLFVVALGTPSNVASAGCRQEFSRLDGSVRWQFPRLKADFAARPRRSGVTRKPSRARARFGSAASWQQHLHRPGIRPSMFKDLIDGSDMPSPTPH
jgi:hypothetical protein